MAHLVQRYGRRLKPLHKRLFFSFNASNWSWNQCCKQSCTMFCHFQQYPTVVRCAACVKASQTLAPFLQSRLTISTCPAAAARQRGVMPLSVVPSTTAPISRSKATISTCPRWAWTARMGACPITSVHQVTLAPPSISRRLTWRKTEINLRVLFCEFVHFVHKVHTFVLGVYRFLREANAADKLSVLQFTHTAWRTLEDTPVFLLRPWEGILETY